ncbi:MAG: LytTR family DNA-binding domain-containing protein [Bacteroidetes bacterium]|nr:LytTR family DNA-binding domain-containing protein [Bacteroidota bacterium]
MIKTIIVDDEHNSGMALANLVKSYCPQIELMGMADNVDAAFKLINEENPDLLFLDIVMPGEDGFALLKKFNTINFDVIFTTAYDQYALQAIKFSALDYLMKPIDLEELKTAIAKVEKKLNVAKENNTSLPEKIIINTDKSLLLINPLDIIRIEAEGKKIDLFLKNNLTFVLRQNLSEFEPRILNYGFFRCHRSHMINLTEISEYIPDKNGGALVMTDKKMVPLAISNKKDFLEKFEARK